LENAEKSLSLNPSLGLAHLALANLHEVHWRWAEAREAYEIAYELSPNDITLLTYYGRFKRSSGDYADAIRVGAQTVKLDPLNAPALHQLGVTYRYARDYEAAAQAFRRVNALSPLFIGAHTLLGVVEATRRNFDEASRSLEIAEELSGNTFDQVFRYPQLAVGYAIAGRQEDAERLIRLLEDRSEQSPVGEAVWALAYIALDDYDRVIQHLEAAMATPSSASYTTLAEIKANPWGNPMLDEPRFKEVLAEFWPE
jgi:tetratricopeptide (TPR) repeat protein